MELLEAHQLTRYQRGEPLFRQLRLTLESGTRLGVVGPNGGGKSTLLRLLAGVEPPDEGRVVRVPGIRLAYLPQTSATPGRESVWSLASAGLRPVFDAEARLRDEERRLAGGEPREDALAEALADFERLGGYRAEGELRELLAALGFPEAEHDRPASDLSAGERRRLALAATLAGAPDIVLLDEPTNHLDLSARAWLAGRLAAWAGAVVLVSHDRALLDRATTSTLFLGAGAAELRRGSYGRAQRAREQALHALRRRDAAREKEARRLRAMTQALAARGNRGAARRKHAADRRLAALAGLEADIAAELPPERSTAFDLDPSRRGGRGVVLEATALRRSGVLDVPNVRLLAGRHVALLGPNGSGKSTLLGLLAGTLASEDPRAELRTPAGLRLASVGQLDRGLQPGRSVLGQLEAVAPAGRARQLLAEAGIGAERWDRPPDELSGGERARAGLALLQAREPDLLLLDEPSNDLDLPAIEALERALTGSGAALVLATHDRRLAESVADEVWAIQAGELRRYPDVAAYLAGGPTTGARAALPDGEEDVGPDPEEASRSGAAEDAAARLDALEDEARTVDELLQDPLRLGPRELERLQIRRRALDDALSLAYDARYEPPAPRFRVREHGVAIVAERRDDGLVVLAVEDEAAARAMAERMRRLAQGPEAWAGATHTTGYEGNGTAADPWPWAQVTRVGGVAHVALNEPTEACMLPWARGALADGAARLAFLLLDITALQLFSSDPLPGTRLQPAADGWWALSRSEFARGEGLKEPPEDAAGPRRRRARRRGRGRRRSGNGS